MHWWRKLRRQPYNSISVGSVLSTSVTNEPPTFSLLSSLPSRCCSCVIRPLLISKYTSSEGWGTRPCIVKLAAVHRLAKVLGEVFILKSLRPWKCNWPPTSANKARKCHCNSQKFYKPTQMSATPSKFVFLAFVVCFLKSLQAFYCGWHWVPSMPVL